MRFFKAFHEDSDHDVDEDELRHQDEHDEEEGRDVLVDAAVAEAVVGLIALLAQRVLHDPVPVVPRGDPEEREEGHSKSSEVSVLTQSLEESII